MSKSTPLEQAISRAMQVQQCTATELANRIGMAPTNFSLARNSRRSFPLPALLELLDLSDFDADIKLKTLHWIAFKQNIGAR